MLFTQSKKWLSEIKELKFELEKHLQDLVEKDLNKIFWLRFVSSEFQLNWLRIDSLAFDDETNSFVIIEYKRDRSFSVIDQWYAYLSLMLNNKADFILEYFEKTGKQIKRDDVSWSESKVIFVANSFTIHQRQAINFKDLPIELWEAKKYQWDLYSFNRIKADKQSESVKTISKDASISKVSKEIKTYSISDHIKPEWEKSKALYDELRDSILALDERLDEDPKKVYIWFKIWNLNALAIKPRKSKIVMEFLRVEPKDLKDPDKVLRYFNNSKEYYGKHVSVMDINSKEDIMYAVMLSKQVLDKFFS